MLCQTEGTRMFQDFYGNQAVAETLRALTNQPRIPQTILLEGQEGLGKATLARRFAAALAGEAGKIERDDLSLEANAAAITDREKWPADKRNEDQLIFGTDPAFVHLRADGWPRAM